MLTDSAASVYLVDSGAPIELAVTESRFDLVDPGAELVLDVQDCQVELIADAPQGFPGPQGQPGRDGSGTLTTVESVNAADHAIHPGQAVRVDGAGLVLAQADDEAHIADGLALALAAVGQALDFVALGPLELTDWTLATGGSATLIPGATYWLSQGGAGVLTTIGPDGPSGTIVQVLARALSPTLLLVQLEQPTIL